MRKRLGHLWQDINQRVEDLSSYIICFGFARGCLLLASRTIRPGSGTRTVLAPVPGSHVKLLVRPGTSDIVVFNDVYHGAEHEWAFSEPPQVILDGGAYTGLSAAYFAMRYPEAQVIAVEPDRQNYALLTRNVSPFKNIRAINAALWSETGTLEVVDPGRGAWGLSVTESGEHGSGASGSSTVPALTVSDIMRECGLDRIDLLKLDIEGSEKEVLASSDSWIKHVEAVSVELHDRFRPGCSRAFYGAVSDFPMELRRGEKVLVARAGCSIIPLAAQSTSFRMRG